MKYCEIVTECEKLNFKDKVQLTQFLIQCTRKEEENSLPEEKLRKKKGKSLKNKNATANDLGSIEYVVKRILKLKPTKKKSLKISIKAIFQSQGGISESDEKEIISTLQKHRYIKIDPNNNVTYL